MSLAVFTWMTAGTLVACAAAACLWRASARAEPSVKNAYRWLAVVALAWGAALVVQEGLPGPGLAESLTLADLLALIVLPVLAVGVVALAPARATGAADEAAPARQAGAITARLADGCLLVAALFVVGWMVFYGPAYARGGVSAGVFAHDMIHPLADLVVLGILLVYVGDAWRRSLLPWLALLAVTAGDSLAISARIAGLHPGAWALLAQLAGLCLLAAVPLVRPGPQWRWRSGPAVWPGRAPRPRRRLSLLRWRP